MRNVLLFLCCFSTVPLFSEITIKGNHRIESSTILGYLTFQKASEANTEQINSSIKQLNDTKLFSEIKIRKIKSNLVEIEVNENPIVNKLVFEGNKKVGDDVLEKFFTDRIKSRTIFRISEIKSITKDILNIYRAQGRFLTKVEPKIIRLPDNRVNVVFEIEEGPIAIIKKITFIGNTTFSDSQIKSKLASKEHAFWKFWTSDDIYAPEKLELDKKQIKDFYKNNGYIDVDVVSAISELSQDKKNFFLTFKIIEGKSYNVTKIEINSEFLNINKNKLFKCITQKIGTNYSLANVEESENEILEQLSEEGFLFSEIETKIIKLGGNQIKLIFDISKGPKVYIDKIIISGNMITQDSVIRREMTLDEKDAFNSLKLRESNNKVRDLDFFSLVNIEQQNGDSANTVNLNVNVTEKSTAHIEIGAGLQIGSGIFGKLGIMERNFLGTGRALSSSITIGQRDKGCSIQIVEPYFLGKKLSLMGEVGFATSKRAGTTSYSDKSLFFGFSLGYDITKNLMHTIGYKLSLDKMKNTRVGDNFYFLRFMTPQQRAILHLPDPSRLSPAQQKELNELSNDDFGNRTRSKIYNTLTFAKLDSYVNPRSGYVMGIMNEYCGVGGNVHFMSNTIMGKYFIPIGKTFTFMIKAEIGAISSGALLEDRFSLGGDTLKGFDYDGVGPREKFGNEYAVRGRRYYSGMVALKMPIIDGDMSLDGIAFSQCGALWNSGKNKIYVHDDKKLRLNIGVGLEWQSPMGPIAVTYSNPIKKCKYDETQRFQIGYFITK